MGAVLPRQADGSIDALAAALAVVEKHKQVFVSHKRTFPTIKTGHDDRATQPCLEHGASIFLASTPAADVVITPDASCQRRRCVGSV
jgi:hypothetical protein